MEQGTGLLVNGFSFDTEQEANAAALELKKIQYLESKIDYADTRKVQAIYEKAVKERFFHTAVGLFYLKGIRDFLTREDERYEAVLPVVPVPSFGEAQKSAMAQEEGAKPQNGKNEQNAEYTGNAKTKTAQIKRDEKKQKELDAQKQKFLISVLINVVLTIAVIAMFWIATHTKEPNILNYEKAIKNRYAAWEQELTDREKVIREKELLLFRESELE